MSEMDVGQRNESHEALLESSTFGTAWKWQAAILKAEQKRSIQAEIRRALRNHLDLEAGSGGANVTRTSGVPGSVARGSR